MNLAKKKMLASKVLGTGKKRIVFVSSRLNEIKEAITKQDIRDLKNSGAIIIKEIRGKRRNQKKSKKTGPGKIKKKVNKRKRTYISLTRKLRAYLYYLKKQNGIQLKDYKDIRKKIRNKFFKSKAHLKEYIREEK